MSATAAEMEMFLRSSDPVQQRAAALAWVLSAIAHREANGSRDMIGRYLADALLDLDRGYTSPVLKAVTDHEDRGRTRGTRANARARAVIAAEVAEEYCRNAAHANRLVAFRAGMTFKSLKRLRENIADGLQKEVSSLLLSERRRWEGQLQSPENVHESLFYLALTEVWWDRPFHRH